MSMVPDPWSHSQSTLPELHSCIRLNQTFPSLSILDSNSVFYTNRKSYPYPLHEHRNIALFLKSEFWWEYMHGGNYLAMTLFPGRGLSNSLYHFPWIHDTNGLTRSGSRITGCLPHTSDIYTESLNSHITKLTKDGDGSKHIVLGNDVDIYLTEAITTLEQIILLLQ